MAKQNLIKRTLRKPENIRIVRRLLADRGPLTRTQLVDLVCEHFELMDARGRLQRSTCAVALRDLARCGHFELPGTGRRPRGPEQSPRRLDEAVPPPRDVPITAGAVQGLQLLVVESDEQMRIWNEMMIREHPRGFVQLAGYQLRYLIGSDHGWLGALGFGAAALNLRDRDDWIGWDRDTRFENLHRVVSLSRFLIRDGCRCRNLASRVLGLCVKQCADDFEAKYGFRPWLLETFVDTDQYTGSCFKAANWTWVGRTQGRGRQDRARTSPESVKDVYLMPLNPMFRTELELAPTAGRSALSMTDGLDTEPWALLEFGDAPLGDSRLSRRLVECAAIQGDRPGVSFNAASEGDWSTAKGYYRLIDQDEDSAVTADNILLPHRLRTIRRMKAERTVLCIQDGTSLDFSSLGKCTGLGVIGSNQTGAQTQGLHLHSTLATTTDGLPLGVIRAEFSAPTPTTQPDDRASSEIPVEDKKTFSWIQGLRDCATIAQEMPHTRIVAVMDREADFIDLLDEQRKQPKVHIIVRARYDRCTSGDKKLFDTVRSSPIQGKLQIQVPRQSARPKRSKQKARPAREARTAVLSLRFTHLELKPPPYRPDMTPVPITAIEATEDNPPDGVEPIRWLLLTSLAVPSAEHAARCLAWYCMRWRIEDWHRVLKSGCHVERIAHRTRIRLERAVAINLVIAWRIMLMALLGRSHPDLPPGVLFSDLEIPVLALYAKKGASLLPTPSLMRSTS